MIESVRRIALYPTFPLCTPVCESAERHHARLSPQIPSAPPRPGGFGGEPSRFPVPPVCLGREAAFTTYDSYKP